jgi:histidinol-phosphate aminotransferase
VIRFDGNTSPSVPPFVRAEALAGALAEINTYPHGGYPGLDAAIARYAGVAPENVVLGAGADDVILLVTRSFAGPGDRVAIANDPTYGLFANAVGAAGADVGDDDPALTICCRPNNPTGELGDLPDARPLMVDEAYFEYSGVTAADLIDNDDVIVVRTFSKAFGLAGARVGYALAGKEIAAELNRRQGPAPVSTLSVALVLAGLESPSDVRPILEERERFASALRAQGLEPLPSAGNFLAVPLPEPFDVANRLSLSGLPVRPYRDGIRITVRGRQDDDVLLAALAEL